MSGIVERLRHAADWGEQEFDVLSPQDAAKAADIISDLLEALEPFTDLRAQTGAHGIISKRLDGMAPITVTVTKAQMLRAVAAIAKATKADNA